MPPAPAPRRAWDGEETLSPTTSPGARARSSSAPASVKGGAPSRALGALAFATFAACVACVAGLAFLVAPHAGEGGRLGLRPGALALLARGALLPDAPGAAGVAVPLAGRSFRAAEGPPVPRADAGLERGGRSHVAGGLLSLPAGFSSERGDYDLVLHFHGNTSVVEESYATLPLNAAVVVFNVGQSSRPYEERFASPTFLSEARERARAVLAARGLENPRERRIALSAWSAGYAAVARILERPRAAREVDAVLLLDGMHSNFRPDGSVDRSRIASLFRFAERAARGDALFLITHSEIDPREYAGVKRATDALLAELGVPRRRPGPPPAMPDLASVRASVSKSKRWPLRPRSEAREKGLFVRHYAGEKAEDHMSHLLQMRAIALPELAARWKRAPDGRD